MRSLFLVAALTVSMSQPSFAESNLMTRSSSDTTSDLAPGRIHKAVQFDYGKVRVRWAGRTALAAIASTWKASPTRFKIRVEGHGYAIDEEASIQLGQKRAERVRDYLVKQGVDPKYIEAVGHSRGDVGRYVDLVFEPAKR